MKRLVTLLAALAALQTYAQRIEATLPSPDAKSLGMGGVMMTTLSGSHAIYNNSATAIFSHTPSQVSSSYYGQRSFDYYAVSGFCRFDNINLVQAGWRQFLREHGNNDMAVDLGYARRIGDRWAVGIVGRYMHLKRPDISADALAVDLSAAWQRPLENVGSYSTLRAGAKLGNLGGYLRDTEYTLPMDFTVGAALDTFLTDAHEITVGTDLGYYFSPSAVRGFQMSLGVEYNLMQLVQLRTGYHYGERRDYYPSYWTVGAGLRILHLRLDFAYLFAKKHSASVSGWISDVKPASPTRSGFIPGRTSDSTPGRGVIHSDNPSGSPSSKGDFSFSVFGEIFQNPLAAVFQHVEHQFEALVALVVGIGHVGAVGMAAAELRHAENLPRSLARGSQPVERLVVHVVHRHDHVEAVEILLPDLPRTVRQRIAAARGRAAHARIGQFAAVSPVGSRGVDPERPGQAASLHDAAHDALGGRRTADIAEADKQYSRFHMVEISDAFRTDAPQGAGKRAVHGLPSLSVPANAARQMVVDEPRGLQMGVTNRGAEKFEAPFFHVPAHGVGFG